MKTIKVIYQEIESCNDCPHIDHTGAFTKGGAKPCCNHPKTVKLKGNNCKKRIIPSKMVYDSHGLSYGGSGRKPKKIPKWCPLLSKKDVQRGFKYSQFAKPESDCDASEVDLY